MKKVKKLLSLLMVLVLMGVFAAGCGNKKAESTDAISSEDTQAEESTETAAPEKITLKVWAPEEEQEVTKEMCDLFQKNHPEYEITFDVGIMSVADSIDAIKKDSEVAADVFAYPSGGVPELVEAGLILPITVDLDSIKNIHSEAAIKSCTLNDLLYGVPQSPNSWFMYYDKSKYTEDDVTSLEKMLAKDLGNDIKNFSCDIDNSWYMSAFFYANGGTLYGTNGDDPTECSWNDEKGLKAAKYLLDLAKNPKYVDDQDGLGGSLMKEGKLAALCSGTWAAEDLQAALGDNYAAVKLPTINIDGTDYQLSNFADFRAVGVNSASKAPKAAQQLAAWLGGEECQLLRFEKVNSTAPTVKSLIENDQVAANAAVLALSTQTGFSTPNPSTSQLAQYWTPASAFGAGILNGDIKEDNLQASLDAMVEGFLSKIAAE
ncbi:carbohydrate ABC transporter substrate-binding protein (CUT1 family) [Mobilisporobacter senegalensis]|uniref:Carbohydrate ABC transporter substrate-binding protein (CUT1 family) n=1 Tax=Mobilisporobacter senegalensis TaxID=1329262 RepID=A0A3N1XRI5_9FIRM|nr:extracellular solute-binding protein [Mobilisporobacter senegalensis]ROR27417.1 carbohydrate ABC transporter substrate-binding protein (CUT1 family) [Mobilisporobacter senegalensis]